MAFPVADRAEREIPDCRRARVGVSPGDGAGYCHFAADPLAGGAAADADFADCFTRARTAPSEKPRPDLAPSFTRCHRPAGNRWAADGGAPAARCPESSFCPHAGDDDPRAALYLRCRPRTAQPAHRSEGANRSGATVARRSRGAGESAQPASRRHRPCLAAGGSAPHAVAPRLTGKPR
ncbi:hypothetical protein D3C81_1506900 [compost metagenome]